MGSYTELVLKCKLKSVLPEEVTNVLNGLFNRQGFDTCEDLPDHPFFRLTRWNHIGSCSSYYHTPWAASRYAEDHIFSRSDLKNYADEIEAFLDWLRPYISESPEKCIGWTWYEVAASPTLIYAGAPA